GFTPESLWVGSVAFLDDSSGGGRTGRPMGGCDYHASFVTRGGRELVASLSSQSPLHCRPLASQRCTGLTMPSLYLLLPISLLFVLAIGAAFWWAIFAGQFEDTNEAAQSVLLDDDTTPPNTETRRTDS